MGLVIFLMFQRVQVLQLLLFFGPSFVKKPLKAYLKSVRSDKVRGVYTKGGMDGHVTADCSPRRLPCPPHTRAQPQAVFFCKFPSDVYVLNKALTYVRNNEATVASLAIVHCYGDEAEEQQLFEEFERSVELGATSRGGGGGWEREGAGSRHFTQTDNRTPFTNQP